MSLAELRLAADRANRDAAREVFTERLARIKTGLEARSVGARLTDLLKEGTTEAIDAGLDVARERKGLIAGTITALLLWVFRQPLFDAASSLVARLRGEDGDAEGPRVEDEEEDTRDHDD